MKLKIQSLLLLLLLLFRYEQWASACYATNVHEAIAAMTTDKDLFGGWHSRIETNEY